MTRDEYVATFADWLNAPAIREQRLKDDVHDHKVRAYYHWIRDGIDFISLDNATTHQFDAPQLKWLAAVLQNDQRDATIRALVVGMHEALPESLARDHSMSDAPTAEATAAFVAVSPLHRHSFAKRCPVFTAVAAQDNVQWP